MSHPQVATSRPVADPGLSVPLPQWLCPAALGVILAVAAWLRFYGLAWGAPYFHFHIDEHFVFFGAERLRVSMEAAAQSPKFFMYGPLPMHLLNVVVWIYESVKKPLDLAGMTDQVTYMVMGRAISAALATATVLISYFVARRVSGRVGGLVASALAATVVVNIAEAHSFRVDGPMVFFASVAWLCAMRIADKGRLMDYLLAGAFTGAAIASKYSGAFVLGVIAIAHLAAPGRPTQARDVRGWLRWTLRGLSPLVAAAIVFAIADPMVFLYPEKVRQDVVVQVSNPLTGATKPIFQAQFADVQPQLYWFTTNLWWGLGPAIEIFGMLGIVWLVWQRKGQSVVAAAFPLVYFLAAGGVVAPMARYAMPLGPALAVSAGALCAALVSRRHWRLVGIAATTLVVGTSAFYAFAYMNVYRSPDSRLTASRYLWSNVPARARILVEPAHSIPPTGKYFHAQDFRGDYVLWGARSERHDLYAFYALDTYVYLYGRRPTPAEKRSYIESRLKLVDYILMDDTYVQFYQHLPESEHGVVKQYYRDLFSGQLGFDLMQTFKVYPSLFGVTINDDGAELSSRMNDHPRIYLFQRREPR